MSSRTKKALEAIKPPTHIPITCDGYAAYNLFEIIPRCWAHIIRVAKNLKNLYSEEVLEFVKLYEDLMAIFENIKTGRRKFLDAPR